MISGDLRTRLLGAFRGECRERLLVLSSDLMKMEMGSDDQNVRLLIESSYREVHSLKGAARAVGLSAVEKFCQSFESFFSVLKKNGLLPSKTVCGVMVGWLDILEELIANEDGSDSSLSAGPTMVALAKMDEFVGAPELIIVETGGQKTETLSGEEHAACCVEIEAEVKNEIPEEPEKEVVAEPQIPTARMSMGDTVRVDSSFLTGLLLQTEELLSSRNSQEARASEVAELSSKFSEFSRFFCDVLAENKKITDEADDLISMKMEKKMTSFAKRLGLLSSSTQKAHRDLSSKVDTLLSEFKSSMLLPFSSLLEVFPRMVRSLSSEIGKQCDFKMSGESVRIDRRILELLHDPLMHMVRNSVGHGLETPAERIAKGKAPTGNIYFEITQTDRDIVRVVIGDDGIGIDTAKLKGLALKQGLLSSREADELNHNALLELIFMSGMSTSDIITDISGRGLGMAIVRDSVESLGGSVTVSSEVNTGARFVLNIPVALTSFKGIVVEAAGRKFVVPKSGVSKVLLVRQKDIETVGGKETIIYQGKPIPIITLSDILELGSVNTEKTTFPAFIMGEGVKAVAVSMDELHGEQNVMAKPMGPLLRKVRNVSGFTMLGTGMLVPILHGPDMIRTALGVSSGSKVQSFSHQHGVKEVKTVLVAEDSITSRTLLKNVLEAAGYNVITAVDGLDALNRLKAELPDILVSDVEMPHMDGFTLTAEVRKMQQSASLPIILVTSLGSQEHREKGVDAGADAYIIKSSFDQGNLLEVIQRLA
ncbi:hybrid sensor histidine kinase/response regulator [Maridesulfovibrio frigidus]|uniref:hybrid sensor histidine kinase/response regulator n=1 Tax=Maridesulfovibrio frigidus TaxID=340956 RepID=UPI0004E0C85C|nr:response regulator [Maridesulfovibrio frigidus]